MTIAGLTCAAWIALQAAPVEPPRVPVAASSAETAAATGQSADSHPPAAPDASSPLPNTSQTPTPPPSPTAPIRAITEPDAVRKQTLRVSGAILLAVPIFGELFWWRNEETERFHTVHENWFGRDTYAGGADKVSHLFGGYAFAREMTLAFQNFGNPPARSRALATGLTALTGVLVEAGDGFSVYGFSWEDVFSDLVGAGFAAGIGAAKLDDVIGARQGYVQTSIPPKCCRATANGSDYSKEVYSFDLKLVGVLKRMGVTNPGPARFLFLSLTYGSKGYRFSPVEVRQRNVGVDIGLNMVEVLKAVGIRDDTWWGLPLYKFFTYYRVEYTAWGFRYDVNHGKWSGFGTGGKFDPGRVIYQ